MTEDKHAEKGADAEIQETARRAGDAFVNALEGNSDKPDKPTKSWYDAPMFRNIKLGSIASLLVALGVLGRGCVDTDKPVDNPEIEQPGEAVAPTKDPVAEPPALVDYSKFDEWLRTDVPAIKPYDPPVFWPGLPAAEPDELRMWSPGDDGLWYFQRTRQKPEARMQQWPGKENGFERIMIG